MQHTYVINNLCDDVPSEIQIIDEPTVEEQIAKQEQIAERERKKNELFQAMKQKVVSNKDKYRKDALHNALYANENFEKPWKLVSR